MSDEEEDNQELQSWITNVLAPLSQTYQRNPHVMYAIRPIIYYADRLERGSGLDQPREEYHLFMAERENRQRSAVEHYAETGMLNLEIPLGKLSDSKAEGLVRMLADALEEATNTEVPRWL